jgi:hypothetical protein
MSSHTDTHPQPTGLELNVEMVRRRLDATIRELDRRRHDALDIKLQLRRHALPVIAGLVVLVAGVTSLTLLLLRRRGNRKRLLPKMQRLRQAVARMVEKPDRVARENPNVARKIATAAGTTAATMLAKKLMRRLGADGRAPEASALAGAGV